MALVKLCRHILLTVRSTHTVWPPKDHYVFVRQKMLSTTREIYNPMIYYQITTLKSGQLRGLFPLSLKSPN
jgi:hypothetical protein